MAITFDNTGTASGNSVTSLSVNISGATTGAWCYCFTQVGTTEPAGFTMTGWQQLCDQQEGSSSHFGLYRRVKQSGDTTFTVSWTNSTGATACWASYLGLNSTYPEEGFLSSPHTSGGATYTTPTNTPADATRWALCGVGTRSTSTSGETWTAPGTQTIRSQVVNTAANYCASAIADSNGTVTQAAHNYAFTLSSSESHGGTVLCYLVPGTSTNPVYPGPEIKDQAVQRAANW